MANFATYISEAYDELIHKVSWPSWPELQQTTVIVLVGLLVITTLILGMDFGSEKITKLIYSFLS